MKTKPTAKERAVASLMCTAQDYGWGNTEYLCVLDSIKYIFEKDSEYFEKVHNYIKDNYNQFV